MKTVDVSGEMWYHNSPVKLIQFLFFVICEYERVKCVFNLCLKNINGVHCLVLSERLLRCQVCTEIQYAPCKCSGAGYSAFNQNLRICIITVGPFILNDMVRYSLMKI